MGRYEAVREAAKITKYTLVKAREYLNQIWYQGVHSGAKRARAVSGIFVPDIVVPEAPTGRVLEDTEVTRIRAQAQVCMRRVPLRSPVTTGVPPLSRARDIFRDGVVHYNPLHVLLVPVFGRVRALGLPAARLPASMPQTPARVFVSQYPEGYQSGMAVQGRYGGARCCDLSGHQ